MTASRSSSFWQPLWRAALVVALAVLGLAVSAPAASADAAPVSASYALPDAYLGMPYSQQLTAVGGVGPYSWNFVGGVGCDPVPLGLTISDDGLVSGTPTFAFGHCAMHMSVIDHSPTGGTIHPATVTFTVQAALPPCDIASFAAALADAADDSVVTLCNNLDATGHPLAVPPGRNVTLDLAGHTLNAPSLNVPAGTSVTITDTAAGGPGPAGSATFGGIADDGTVHLDPGTHVTSNGAIGGAGKLTGDGYSGKAAATLQNNGAVTVPVSGIAVSGHVYHLTFHQNDGGADDILGSGLTLYAATLADAGISIARDWSARDRPGYTLSGWYLTPDGSGAPLTDSTDFSTIAAAGAYVDEYAGWSATWYANSATGNDGNSCASAATACQTIGAALAKAGNHDTVLVAAGDYGSAHGDRDLKVTKSVTLQGVSAATVTVAQAVDATAPAIAVSGGAQVTVSGMTVIGAGTADAVLDASGAGTTLTLSDTDVTDDGADGGPLDGLEVHGGAHADVTGGTIHDLPFGIQIADAGTLTLNGTTVRDNGNSGIVFATDAGVGSTIDAAVVSGNGITTEDGKSVAVGNAAGVTAQGGGLQLTATTLTGNAMGLIIGSPAVTITGGTVKNNLAGGIGVVGPDANVLVDGVAIRDNNGTVLGATGRIGLSVLLGGTATVKDSVISGSGVGISNMGGHVTVTGSSITGNRNVSSPDPVQGGGIVTTSITPAGEPDLPATMSVTNSTLAGNSSGLLAVGGTATVTNSTIADNGYFGVVADSNALGTTVTDAPVVSIVRSTIAANGSYPTPVIDLAIPLAGVATDDDGAVTVAGSLVTAGIHAPACAIGSGSSTIADAGYSLADDGTCPFTGAGSLTKADPELGALADNGSAATPVTKTMLPGAGSPALDRIPRGTDVSVSGIDDVALCAADSMDQRGAARPAPSAAKCDIGAAERDESADAATDPADPTGPAGTHTGPGGIEVLGESGGATGTRIAGSDRYATAALLAEGFGRADAIVIANGTDAKQGMDALAANYLAGRVHAPILLTTATAVTPQAVSALKAVLAGSTDPTIDVMGGVDSVSAAVVTQLVAAARTVANGPVRVRRIAGPDRYATAAKAAAAAGPVANSVMLGSGIRDGAAGATDAAGGGTAGAASDTSGDSAGAATTAILASGEVSADALAAGPLAYAWGLPVLLTGSARLPGATRAAIAAEHITALIVLGGADRIPGAVLDQARAAGVTVIRRVAGADRFGTAAALYDLAMDTATDEGKHYGTDGAAAYLANGMAGLADALAAGPIAGQDGGVLLTVPAGRLPKATAAFLAQHAGSIGSVIGLGTPTTVTAAVLAAATARLG